MYVHVGVYNIDINFLFQHMCITEFWWGIRTSIFVLINVPFSLAFVQIFHFQ